MLLVYLTQGFLSGTIQFELHDIGEMIGLQYQVHTPLGSVIFHMGIETEYSKNNEKNVLIVTFHIKPGCQIVGNACKESGETPEERLIIDSFFLEDKLQDFEIFFFVCLPVIKRLLVFDETFLHLTVWKPKAIH